MAELVASDRAELMAESLGIPVSSYVGRTADATVAMALVAGYRRLTYQDKNQVLYIIRDQMGFGSSNPAFFQGCQSAIALMTANPVWVPGSLGNDELEQEITFWRNVSATLKELGFSGIGYAGVKGRSVLQEIGKNVRAGDPKSPPKMTAITGPIRSALKPNPLSGILILGMAAKTISDSAVTDLAAEATRRGQLGTITPLHAERFGKPGN